MSDPKFPPIPTVILTHNAGPATPHDHLGEVLSSALDWEHRAREAEARARQACQTLVEAFGSVGPESVEHAAVRAAEAHARLLDTASELPGLRMTLDDLLARVAELEAAGNEVDLAQWKSRAEQAHALANLTTVLERKGLTASVSGERSSDHRFVFESDGKCVACGAHSSVAIGACPGRRPNDAPLAVVANEAEAAAVFKVHGLALGNDHQAIGRDGRMALLTVLALVGRATKKPEPGDPYGHIDVLKAAILGVPLEVVDQSSINDALDEAKRLRARRRSETARLVLTHAEARALLGRLDDDPDHRVDNDLELDTCEKLRAFVSTPTGSTE